MSEIDRDFIESVSSSLLSIAVSLEELKKVIKEKTFFSGYAHCEKCCHD